MATSQSSWQATQRIYFSLVLHFPKLRFVEVFTRIAFEASTKQRKLAELHDAGHVVQYMTSENNQRAVI